MEADTARVKPTLWRHPPPFQPQPQTTQCLVTVTLLRRARAALSDLTNNSKTTRGGSIAGKVRPPRPPGHRAPARGSLARLVRTRLRGPAGRAPRTPAPDARPPALLLQPGRAADPKAYPAPPRNMLAALFESDHSKQAAPVDPADLADVNNAQALIPYMEIHKHYRESEVRAPSQRAPAAAPRPPWRVPTCSWPCRPASPPRGRPRWAAAAARSATRCLARRRALPSHPPTALRATCPELGACARPRPGAKCAPPPPLARLSLPLRSDRPPAPPRPSPPVAEHQPRAVDLHG